MNPALQEKYLRVEEHQWWCKARRDIVLDLAMTLAPHNRARILEIGCSGGLLLEKLTNAGYRHVHGVDLSDAAIAAARRRGVTNVEVMNASKLSFPDRAFDLLIASDVLEHIANAQEALREWRRVLAPDAKLIVFVPAFEALWSSHDDANQHFRRYSRRQLAEVLEGAGLCVERLSYWNALLTIPGVMLNAAEKVAQRSSRPSDTGGLVQPPPPFNWLLYRLIALENATLRYVDLPFGTSVFAVASSKAGVRW
jgi:ubiquinone/menaquinone biosynthesis C-methylase UbiE